ncbi:RDD family protein [Stakelama sp. CBK3Z-3]|uniref:RDD family protein n=1 Tax=Stakelama flava TaxID=2860338 RepID=A0ABS6XJD7_9SPHN|nr:RDD family protein [Stakelama flava]MBW4330297.1 RDD family protein [Stakelama flava]
MARPGRDRSLIRRLVTPEGVPLHLNLASAGARASAFIIDMLLIAAILIALTCLALFGFYLIGNKYPGIVLVIWLIGFFLLRNFYFIWFESGRRAATWGKRRMGLRVIARDGGQLTGAAVVARNMMREVEVFLPLMFLGFGAAEGFVDRWTMIAGFGWACLFLFLPVFNRDRLRAGDLIAGTWVVENARRDLGIDLVAQTGRSADAAGFSQAELEVYGQYELQRLEAVLREGNAEAITTVADVIRGKLNRWDPIGDRAFLDAYYAQTRAHFERGLLMGRRKRDKFDTSA